MQKIINYTSLALSIITLVVLFATGIGGKPWEAVNALAAVISGLASSLGLLLIAMQLRSAQKLSKAQFVNELCRDIDNYVETDSRLDIGGIWYTNGATMDKKDEEAIEKYLSFFERIKHILDAQVVDMETIDELFAYRFFYLVHNPNVQSKVIFDPEVQPYYRSLFHLYALWVEYRQTKGLPIPRAETPLILK